MAKESENKNIKEMLGNMDPNIKVVFEEFSHMVGRLLTIIEAATADKQQRKSLKDIVQRTVYDTRNAIISRLGGDGK